MGTSSPLIFLYEIAISQAKRGNIVAVVAQDRPDGDDMTSTPDYLSYVAGRVSVW